MADYPTPPLPEQQQPMPGFTKQMNPVPDHGEQSYRGSGRLAGKKAIITGGDSGIGRAVAIAYAREGADLLISCGASGFTKPISFSPTGAWGWWNGMSCRNRSGTDKPIDIRGRS